MTSIVPESIEYHIGSIPPALLMSWAVWVLIGIPSLIISRTIKLIPGKLQCAGEGLLGMIFNMADEFIGEDAPRYYPLFVGIFLFILTANLIGLIPGFMSPTANLNVTLSLALAVFVYYNAMGFRAHGVKYLAHFFGPPLPWYLFPVRILMFIIEVISHCARPFSLALRLFCNIFSKEILLGLLALLEVNFFMSSNMIEKGLTLAPLILRPFIILLGVLISFIQALIFLVLSIAYVAGAVKSEEHE